MHVGSKKQRPAEETIQTRLVMFLKTVYTTAEIHTSYRRTAIFRSNGWICFLRPAPAVHRYSGTCITPTPLPSKRVEDATRNFSAQELARKKRGGLYSTIGRSKVGLIESDIDDLTATTTGRSEVLTATKRAAVAKSLGRNNVLAELLGGDKGKGKGTILPTVSPACFRGPPGSRPDTPVSPKRPPSRNDASEQSKGGVLSSNRRRSIATIAKAQPEEGLEASGRLRVFGTDENQHRENIGGNLRRLRALLGECDFKGEIRRAGTPSLFSVRELRAIRAAGIRRKRLNTPTGRANAFVCAGETQEAGPDQGGVKETASEQEEGTVAQLAVGGDVLLRNLAKALFSSMQRRIQKDFLLLGFQKWKVRDKRM